MLSCGMISCLFSYPAKKDNNNIIIGEQLVMSNSHV
jgi:hypothetical protein